MVGISPPVHLSYLRMVSPAQQPAAESDESPPVFYESQGAKKNRPAAGKKPLIPSHTTPQMWH
jgi:hypothetical protein